MDGISKLDLYSGENMLVLITRLWSMCCGLNNGPVFECFHPFGNRKISIFQWFPVFSCSVFGWLLYFDRGPRLWGYHYLYRVGHRVNTHNVLRYGNTKELIKNTSSTLKKIFNLKYFDLESQVIWQFIYLPILQIVIVCLKCW